MIMMKKKRRRTEDATQQGGREKSTKTLGWSSVSGEGSGCNAGWPEQDRELTRREPSISDRCPLQIRQDPPSLRLAAVGRAPSDRGRASDPLTTDVRPTP